MEIAIYYCCIRSGNLNAGKHISRKDGASIFGTYVDIICSMLIGLIFSSSIAEKVGVNIWFLISGFCMIMLTVLVVIRYVLKARSKK